MEHYFDDYFVRLIALYFREPYEMCIFNLAHFHRMRQFKFNNFIIFRWICLRLVSVYASDTILEIHYVIFHKNMVAGESMVITNSMAPCTFHHGNYAYNKPSSIDAAIVNLIL